MLQLAQRLLFVRHHLPEPGFSYRCSVTPALHTYPRAYPKVTHTSVVPGTAHDPRNICHHQDWPALSKLTGFYQRICKHYLPTLSYQVIRLQQGIMSQDATGIATSPLATDTAALAAYARLTAPQLMATFKPVLNDMSVALLAAEDPSNAAGAASLAALMKNFHFVVQVCGSRL